MTGVFYLENEMSKASDLDSARLQGMQYALRRINETGLDEFEKELKWRSSVKIGVNLRPQELLEAAHNIQKKLDATMRAMAILTLYDEFDFDQEEVQRFVNRWNLKAECLLENYAEWDDYIRLVEEITGENFEVEYK